MNHPRRLDNIVHGLLAQTRTNMDRQALIAAHTAAANFHTALAYALEAEFDIENGGDTMERRSAYTCAVVDAGRALMQMPVRWAGVLESEVSAVTKLAAAE